MKLKTLKDMEHIIIKASNKDKKIVLYDSYTVADIIEYLNQFYRQEAITWIKHYRELNKKTEVANEQGANYLIQEWIKNFFNITDSEVGDNVK